MHDQRHAAASASKPLRFSLRTLFLTVTIVALLLSGFVLLATIFNSDIFFPFPKVQPKPFDQIQWKAWSIEDMRQSENIRRAFARRDMLDDLLATHKFSGWSEPELTNLLGPSNPEFCPDEWDVAYLLGMDWVDYVVLVFRLDEEGTVEGYRVIMF